MSKKSSRTSFKKALRESEERFRVFFEASPDSYFVNDLQGNLVDCNKAAEQLLGWKREEILGKNFMAYKIYADEELPRVQLLLQRLVSGSMPDIIPQTFSMLKKDGSQVEVELFGHIVAIRDEKLLYVVARDVTSRVRSEQQLKESELRYQSLVSHLPDAIYIYDDGKYIYSNEAGISILGLDNLAQLLGHDILQFVHPDYHDMIRERCDTIEQSKSAAPLVEQKLVRLDGTVIDIDVRSIPFPYKGKNMVLAIVRDISVRKAIETALRRSEEALRTFIEQSIEGIIIIGEDGRVIEWNDAMATISGLTREQATGSYFWDVHQLLLPPGKRDAAQLMQARKMIQKYLQTGKVAVEFMTGEVQICSADGASHCIQLKVFPINTPLGFRLGVVAQDITPQKDLEKRVLEVSDQVQRQIGHDLHDGVNQLLMVLKLRLSVLQDDLRAKDAPAAEEAGRLTGMIKQAMEQMISLTQGLSPVSIEHGGLVAALNELVKTTELMFNIKCAGDIDGSVVLSDLSTATHLYRIAQEAVNNAVKHAHADSINIKLEGRNNGLHLEVSDDGKGFKPVETHCNGMGLAIMSYRAKLIGASLNVSKNTLGGTTVSCIYNIESH